MIRHLYGLIVHDRLDRMTANEITEAGNAGLLTFSEMKRIAALGKVVG